MAERRAACIRVLVVGAYPLFDEALCALLAGLPGIELAGASLHASRGADLTSLLAVWPETPPDLVLLARPQLADPSAKLRACLEQLSALHREHPYLRVLCLSFTWTPDQALGALQAGAIGCLSASITADDLAVALRQAARGEVTLSPDLARDLIAHLAEGQPPPTSLYESLTAREQGRIRCTQRIRRACPCPRL